MLSPLKPKVLRPRPLRQKLEFPGVSAHHNGMTYSKLLVAATALSSLAFASCSSAEAKSCAPAGMTIEAMQDAKSAEFEALTPDTRAQMASALVGCLGDPDPTIRDGLAYEGLTQLFREGNLDADQIRPLRDQLLEDIVSDDPDGFARPFAALVLAEVSRTDRVDPWMSETERSDLVSSAEHYLRSVDDYRGYSDTEGWRHGVAHGSDWLMQLSLNPALTQDQRSEILSAVRSQVAAANGHAYIHGEPGRLARPVLFVSMAGEQTAEDWTAWLAPLVEPAPLESWGDAFSSEAELARLHNVKAFLQELFINASVSSNENLKLMLGPVTDAMRALP